MSHSSTFWLKGVSSHLFVWITESEPWHCTFCERQSPPSFPMTNRKWVTLHTCVNGSFITSFPMMNSKWDCIFLWKASSSHLFIWPTASEWDCTFVWKAVSSHLFLWWTASKIAHFCERQSSHILSYDQQKVSEITHFCERQAHHIPSYDQQQVRLHFFVKGSLIPYFPMINRKWVIFKYLFVKGNLIIIFFQQQVSDIAHFVKGSLILYSHHISSYDQQQVSDFASFLTCILGSQMSHIFLHPMFIRMYAVAISFLLCHPFTLSSS